MSLLAYKINRCGQDVVIEDRNMRIVNGLAAEVFTNPRTIKAIVRTVTGVTVFDGTNIERIATHKITIPYQAGITAESWVSIGSKRLRILTVENKAEADHCLVLMCTERGDNSEVVNEA